MSQEEWEMFGSESEDDDTYEDHHSKEFNDASIKCTVNPKENKKIPDNYNIKRHIDNVADEIILFITQQFLRSSRSISLSQRYVGIIGCNGLIENDDTCLTLTRVLEDRIKQRGMTLVSFPLKIPSGQDLLSDEYMSDGAALFRNFYYRNNNLDIVRSDSLEKTNLHHNIYENESLIRKSLVPGGFLLLTMCISGSSEYICENPRDLLKHWKVSNGNQDKQNAELFIESVWDLENSQIVNNCVINTTADKCTMYTIFLTKRPCQINTLSCPWKDNRKQVPDFIYLNNGTNPQTETCLEYERRILSSATISPSISELKFDSNMKRSSHYGTLTKDNIDKAVQALQNHGFVVIKNLFDSSMINQWTDAVLSDFQHATSILLYKHNVDILSPGENGRSEPVSYKEMAMREDLRVDFRDGPCMKCLRQTTVEEELKRLDLLGYICTSNKEGIHPTVIDYNPEKDRKIDVVDSTCIDRKHSLRFHPDILQIVMHLFNPHHDSSKCSKQSSTTNDENGKLFQGNFGRWNFQGRGPDGSPQPLRIGHVGAVISCPGAGDQAIHSDTPHLFEMHDCLPCHYANLFTLGSCNNNRIEGNYDFDGNYTGETPIGGTAFVYGSHHLSISARITADKTTGDDALYQNKSSLSPTVSAATSTKMAQDELYVRVIRPSLSLGDILIFDCRVLHFGLGNRSEMQKRPMLYVNMTHSWFNDPKNWDDRKNIFED